jgi:hypothetical protein
MCCSECSPTWIGTCSCSKAALVLRRVETPELRFGRLYAERRSEPVGVVLLLPPVLAEEGRSSWLEFERRSKVEGSRVS